MSNIYVFNIKDTTIEVEYTVQDQSKNSSSNINLQMFFADDERFKNVLQSVYQDNILSKEWGLKAFKNLGHFFYIPNTNNIVISLGDRESFSLVKYLQIIKKLIKFASERIVESIVWQDFSLFSSYPSEAAKICENRDDMYRIIVFYLLSEFYCFDSFKTKKNEQFLNKIIVQDANYSVVQFSNVMRMVDALIYGSFLVRDLGNFPSNFLTPTKLASYAQEIGHLDNVTVKVLNQKQIVEEKMFSFLAVAQGSVQEPKFIEMHYCGAETNIQPVVLIGKGITFDTGGISIKPSSHMDDMKFDMGGAATVIGVFAAIAKLRLPINLILLVPTCENMPSGTAIKPGDIVSSRSGKSIEILNTDAEGRLILCDALDYAKQFNPKLVIDVATLTGACVIALGTHLAALYSNDDDVASRLLDSGVKTADRGWRMPLMEEYGEKLKSKYADIANISTVWDRYGGSASAAWFLYEFTYDEGKKEHYSWVHLDIAGVFQSNEGPATGRPFMMLMEFLLQSCN